MNFLIRLFVIWGLTAFMFAEEEMKVVAIAATLLLALAIALIETGRLERARHE